MCGITGITDKQIENFEEGIKKMTKVITHRGPDDDGYFIGESVAFGMRRLSIIDLATGRQPISSSDGRYLIFFNGEIYNYKELKKELPDYEYKTESDTEVVLVGFLNWGTEVFPRLRGMFALSIYDNVSGKLILARDPFGIKPVYYWKRGNRIAAFSSEIKSFLTLKNFKSEVNDEAVFNFLSFQYNPLEETFFKGVYKLPPGSFLILDVKTGVYEINHYFKFEFNQKELKEEETKEKIRETLKDSVEHHLLSDVPVGSFLSGGIDSSIIATLLPRNLKTFTVTFGSVSEGREAKETAEPLGTDHAEVTVGADEYFEVLPKAIYHFDEPVADPSALGLYFLAREARKYVKVALSGEGADEFFGGYNIYLEPFDRAKIAWLPRWVLKIISWLPIRGSNYAKRALSKLEDWYIGGAGVFNRSEAGKIWKGPDMSRMTLDNLYREIGGLSESTKMQYIDIHTWLVGDILAKADKMTMAHSLELRVPFIDSLVASLASKLPDSFKWRDGQTKYLLREAFKGLMPESTRKRKKLGFPIPIREWLDRDKGELYETILENEYVKTHFDTEIIQNLIKEHVSRRRDHSRKIYLLLCLALWYDLFINLKS